MLEHIPPEYDGYILGSGKLFPDSRLHLHTNTAKVLALRGPLTARWSGLKGDFALGDPGLLADELVRVETRKYRLGIVPHWTDTDLAHRPEFQQYDPIVISPSWDPLKVVKTIGECNKIVSSSLHGVIVADSFGIARRIEYAPGFDKEGGMWKFKDYHESIRCSFEVGVTKRASKFFVEDVKDQLWDAYRELGSLVRKEGTS